MPETQVPANGNGKHESTKTHNPNEPGVRSLDWDPALVSLVQQTTNSYSSRMEYFNRLMDPRRNLDAECGYPSTYSVGADFYRQLYDRDPIASRVVQLMPKECWQKTPRIYEDEDSKNVTEFERAWDNLGRQLSPERSWYEDEEGSLVWEYLRRADEVSGIGAFGVMLLGLDDGLDLRDPVEGAVSDKYMRDRDGKAKKGTNNSLRLDPAKLSFPTPMPGEETLNEMVANSTTPPMEEWAEHGGVGNKHVDQTEANRHSVRPTFVRNADGERWELLRDDKLVTNEYKAQIGLAANEIGPASKVIQGQDAQYMGVQLGASQYPSEKPLKEKLQLTFLRVFDEALVQIVQYEANIRNPRFSRPVMYRITFNDPREQHSGIGLPLASIYVHWTRIVHLADTGNGVSSEIFAAPRMRPVLNPLLDCRKISGAGAEGYWQSCFAGIVLSTHPQLGGEVQLDVPANKAMMENYFNGLQRFLILSGMGASTIAPSVVDPTPHADLQVKRICIQLGCPKRVFEGSERGELASSQDDSKWNDRVGSRCNTYVTPRVICPFVDRLILLGVLPEPEQYRVEWPDLDSTTKKDKATIASTLTTALQAYVAGNVEAIMTFRDYLVQVWDWDEETVDEVIKSATNLHEKEMTMTMPPKGELGHPATVPPPPPKEPPNPVVMGPGQTMVPHPDHPNAAGQKPFTAPTPPQPRGAKPPTKNEEVTDNWCNQYGGDSCREGGEVTQEEGNDFARSVGIAPKTVGASSPARSGHAMIGRTSNQERIDMPQIRKRYWDDFLAYARARTSVEYEPACDPNDLHAIQSEYDQQRVDDMPMSKLDRPILSSKDGYVLDGNHRWIKAGQKGVTIPVIRLGLDKEFALDLLRAFPQAEYVENLAQGQTRNAVRNLVQVAVADGYQLLFNDGGEDEDSMISAALASHPDDDWFETLLQVALQETQGDVQAAVKFAEQYYAANPDGGEEDDDEEDDDPTGNANPEGCNQHKPCGGGTVGESTAMLKKYDELSNDRESYPRETSKLVVDALRHHSKDDLKKVMEGAGMGLHTRGGKKVMLEKVHMLLDSAHRVHERVQS